MPCANNTAFLLSRALRARSVPVIARPNALTLCKACRARQQSNPIQKEDARP